MVWGGYHHTRRNFGLVEDVPAPLYLRRVVVRQGGTSRDLGKPKSGAAQSFAPRGDPSSLRGLPEPLSSRARGCEREPVHLRAHGTEPRAAPRPSSTKIRGVMCDLCNRRTRIYHPCKVCKRKACHDCLQHPCLCHVRPTLRSRVGSPGEPPSGACSGASSSAPRNSAPGSSAPKPEEPKIRLVTAHRIADTKRLKQAEASVARRAVEIGASPESPLISK